MQSYTCSALHIARFILRIICRFFQAEAEVNGTVFAQDLAAAAPLGPSSGRTSGAASTAAGSKSAAKKTRFADETVAGSSVQPLAVVFQQQQQEVPPAAAEAPNTLPKRKR
jgi:hypothetical protein